MIDDGYDNVWVGFIKFINFFTNPLIRLRWWRRSERFRGGRKNLGCKFQRSSVEGWYNYDAIVGRTNSQGSSVVVVVLGWKPMTRCTAATRIATFRTGFGLCG